MQSGAAGKVNYGNDVAYDLSRFDKRKRVREALENESVALPEIKPRGTTRARAEAEARANARAAVSFSPFAVLSFVAIFALCILVVANCMTLNEYTSQSAKLSSELKALKNEEALLKVQYERKMNIRDIENRAAEMGFSTPQKDQIVYIDISQRDRAVIFDAAAPKSAFAGGLETIALTVGEFFE